jgi:threonine/homoserine/homoserine lactone efflux protein
VAISLVAVSIIAFVVAFIGSLPLAGPIAILVVSNAASGRFKEALRIALGAAVAEGIYAFLAFWGFSTFLARHALVLPISHGVTAVILCGLGVRFLFFKLKAQGAQEADTADSGRFWVGFSISAVNPTLLATWGAVTTFLYSNQIVRFTGILAIPFALCAAAGIAVWGLTVVELMKRFREHLPRVALTWIVRSMGILMIGIGLWSGVALGRYVIDRRSGLDESRSAVPRMAWAADCNASAVEVSRVGLCTPASVPSI